MYITFFDSHNHPVKESCVLSLLPLCRLEKGILYVIWPKLQVLNDKDGIQMQVFTKNLTFFSKYHSMPKRHHYHVFKFYALKSIFGLRWYKQCPQRHQSYMLSWYISLFATLLNQPITFCFTWLRYKRDWIFLLFTIKYNRIKGVKISCKE